VRDNTAPALRPLARIVLSSLLASLLVILVLAIGAAQGTGDLTRITAASDGSRDSTHPSPDATGTVIAFRSDSDFLGQGIPDDQYEIWLYDTRSVTYTRVTTASDANRDSSSPWLSADGKIVAFTSDSDFLGQSIPDEQTEVWLYDTTTLTYTRVTTASDANRDSLAYHISADGTVIAFISDSDLLGQSIPDEQSEVWLYDTSTLTYTRVTTASAANRDSWQPKLSSDGTIVAFQSDSDLLGQGVADGESEIWLYDTGTLTYTRITTGTPAGSDSFQAWPSEDGTLVAFSSYADFLGEGILGAQGEIWLYDASTLTVTRLTSASSADRDSYLGSMSADGALLSFHSDSDLLGEGIPDGVFEVWLYDTTTLTFTRVTSATDSNRSCGNTRLSRDGTVLAFKSDSDFLGQAIPNDQDEIWLKLMGHRVYLPLVLRAAQ
jgi:Tol biopolymer transport system component